MKNVLNQDITSAKTSLHQIPAVYKKYKFNKGSIVLDYGCGKFFDDIKDFSDTNNECVTIGYDPFNRSEIQNSYALDFCKNNIVDYIVCCNVLNVVENDACINNILEKISDLCYYNTKIIFSIYEGNKSGVGKITKKDCFQRNKKTNEYLELIQQFFNVTKVKGNIIEANVYINDNMEAV